MNVDIVHCIACDAPHDDLEVHEFKSPSPPWTHWYTCPTVNDPCPLTLTLKLKAATDETGIAVNNEIIQRLVAAQQCAGYMVAIFVPLDNGQVECWRQTNEYPIDRFKQTWETLRDALLPEIPAEETPAPLKLAKPIAPLVNLFGPEEEEPSVTTTTEDK